MPSCSIAAKSSSALLNSSSYCANSALAFSIASSGAPSSISCLRLLSASAALLAASSTCCCRSSLSCLNLSCISLTMLSAWSNSLVISSNLGSFNLSL